MENSPGSCVKSWAMPKDVIRWVKDFCYTIIAMMEITWKHIVHVHGNTQTHKITSLAHVHTKVHVYLYNLFNNNTYIITLSRGSPILNK